MAAVEIENLYYRAGDFQLRDISLRVADGQYFVLLGKPGSGKTLLLECLVGLRRIDRGRIIVGGQEVQGREPRERGIGYVPQDYALFSTRTVRENIEFGLRVRKLPASERRKRVAELAEMLGITYLLDRTIHGLSGGERQRVALARALAPGPQILVLDEPVSALDQKTRMEILAELKRIQRATGTTIFHVCHDLDEMHFVADYVGILSRGRLLQVGSPAELVAHPASAEVAELLDLGVVVDGEVSIEASSAVLRAGQLAVPVANPQTGPVRALIRAAEIQLAAAPRSGDWWKATVESVLRRDVVVTVVVRCGGLLLRVRKPADEIEQVGELRPGAAVAIYIPPRAVHVFPAAAGRLSEAAEGE